MSRGSSISPNAAGHLGCARRFPLSPPAGDLIRVGSRRWFLQTGLAGLAGLSLPEILRRQALASGAAGPVGARGASGPARSVILFWLSGGPSHIDTWDPKPDAPREVRGPFRAISTKVDGIQVCEHLPLQASIMDRLTVIRSVDCSASDHTPITFQAGNALARRTNDGRDGGGYPSMGSIAARFLGPNDPAMPPFVGLADSWASDVWGAGHMGSAYEPVRGSELAGRFSLPGGVTIPRLEDRNNLLRRLDRLHREVDRAVPADDAVGRMDRYAQQAIDMVLSGKAQRAFRIEDEPPKVREAYGAGSLGEKTLLARRLVEAGVTFVVVSGAWGYFDHHGDEVVWGGIEKGLKPILPTVDRALYALVTDLEARGLLDSTLILMLGEFGREPVMTRTAGRGHWQSVMSMVLAGGGLRHGQVIGSTDERGYGVKTRRVAPADIAATVFRHLRIDLEAKWVSPQGRPTPIVTEGGRPIAELF